MQNYNAILRSKALCYDPLMLGLVGVSMLQQEFPVLYNFSGFLLNHKHLSRYLEIMFMSLDGRVLTLIRPSAKHGLLHFARVSVVFLYAPTHYACSTLMTESMQLTLGHKLCMRLISKLSPTI